MRMRTNHLLRFLSSSASVCVVRNTCHSFSLSRTRRGQCTLSYDCLAKGHTTLSRCTTFVICCFSFLHLCLYRQHAVIALLFPADMSLNHFNRFVLVRPVFRELVLEWFVTPAPHTIYCFSHVFNVAQLPASRAAFSPPSWRPSPRPLVSRVTLEWMRAYRRSRRSTAAVVMSSQML